MASSTSRGVVSRVGGRGSGASAGGVANKEVEGRGSGASAGDVTGRITSGHGSGANTSAGGVASGRGSGASSGADGVGSAGQRTPNRKGELDVGDAVIARWMTDKRWYAASIKTVSKNGRYVPIMIYMTSIST